MYVQNKSPSSPHLFGWLKIGVTPQTLDATKAPVQTPPLSVPLALWWPLLHSSNSLSESHSCYFNNITNLMFAQPQSNTDKPLVVTPIATDEPRQRVHISSDDRGGLKIGQQAMVTIAQNYCFNYSQMFLNLVVVKAYFQLRLLPLSH